MINVVFEGSTGAGKTPIIKKIKKIYDKKYKVGITNDIDKSSPLYKVIKSMFDDNALVSLKENSCPGLTMVPFNFPDVILTLLDIYSLILVEVLLYTLALPVK